MVGYGSNRRDAMDGLGDADEKQGNGRRIDGEEKYGNECVIERERESY